MWEIHVSSGKQLDPVSTSMFTMAPFRHMYGNAEYMPQEHICRKYLERRGPVIGTARHLQQMMQSLKKNRHVVNLLNVLNKNKLVDC